MIRKLPIFCAVLCFLSSARADTFPPVQDWLPNVAPQAPCSPNCSFTDPFYLFNIAIPPTAFTLWDGPTDQIPQAIFAFGLYSTPAKNDLTIADFLGDAYAFSDADLSNPIRHARNSVMQYWANYENGVPGWSKNSDGILFFTYNAPASLDPTATPEPSSLILLGTGVLALGMVAKRRYLIGTTIPSK